MSEEMERGNVQDYGLNLLGGGTRAYGRSIKKKCGICGGDTHYMDKLPEEGLNIYVCKDCILEFDEDEELELQEYAQERVEESGDTKQDLKDALYEIRSYIERFRDTIAGDINKNMGVAG